MTSEIDEFPPNDWPTLMKEASSEITIKRAKTVFFKNEN
jgi:hypothetical protein